MILRSAFWLAVMFILVPHEGAMGEAQSCDTRDAEAGCSPGVQMVEAVQASAIEGLLKVKADLKAAQRAHKD